METNVPLDDQLAWADELASGDEITVHSTTGPYYGDFLEEAAAYGSCPKAARNGKRHEAVDAGEDPAPAVSVWSAETESPEAPSASPR